MTDEQNMALRRAQARKRLEAIKGFAVHATIFALVNAILIAINVVSGPPWWAQWPLIGWGLGVIGHAIAVYGRTPQQVTEWEERKIQQMVKRDSAP